MHCHTQNFARLALDADFHRAAADLAVNGQALKRDTRVHSDFERLAAKRTMNGFICFHDFVARQLRKRALV